MAELREGMRVKVVAIPQEQPDYIDTLGKVGVVEGAPWTDAAGSWCYVMLDGELVAFEFKVGELEPYNVTVLGGEYVTGDGDPPRIRVGGWLSVYVEDMGMENGKRYRITIEEVAP